MNVLQLLQNRLHQALDGLVAEPAPYAAQIKATSDPKHGDYQANCAMALAKALGKQPRAIAQMVVEKLRIDDIAEKPEIAGPGFINLRLRSDWLAGQVQAMARDERLGVAAAAKPRTYVIDYSSPNVAKPMHVGHLRSTIIGDSLTRLLRFLGHTVITDNHLGDWGTQFGMLLYGYKHLVNPQAFQTDPVQELARLYLEVRKLTKAAGGEDDEDPEEAQFSDVEKSSAKTVLEICRQETAKLHAGDPENLRLWQSFMPACKEEIDRVYRRLGILPFDRVFGESYYNPMLAEVVADLQAKGIARESQGAIVVFSDTNSDEVQALVRKRDGAFTYTTSDLATIRYRVQHFKPDAILYVVDSRQALHFKNLFDIARRWGLDRVALEHVSFGSVLGPDRKPLSTRKGSGTSLEALLDQAVATAKKVTRENQENEIEEAILVGKALDQTAEVVGIGAVKYADLSQNRESDYAFNVEKMTETRGNTGTYMQYAYARNRSIFRKGQMDVRRLREQCPTVHLEQPDERALALQLVRFEDALSASAADYRPSQITAYLWDVAKTYSGFFQNCPVLKAENAAIRDSRLLLCDATARVLQRGLDLLGIQTLERL